MEQNAKRVHFIGIGGIGMSGIAEVLHNMGYGVSGSDLKDSPITQHLKNIGIEVFIGHAPSNVSAVDVVVYSNAVPEQNPEIIEAKKRMIPIIPRAEMLNELLRIKRGIGVSGTHGKTTTTSMISFILNEARWDPTLIIGGILNTLSSNAHLGDGEFLVYEGCEAFGSINYLNSEIVVLTNIDNDHMEFYKSEEDLKETFLNYINRIPFYGFAVLNGDDPKIQSILPQIRKKFYLFGFNSSNQIYAHHVKCRGFKTTFQVSFLGKNLGVFELNVPGKHNIYNALAAISVACNLGIEPQVIKKAMKNFVNANRRFQFIGEKNKVVVVDDYAHHPTEVAATLDGAFQLKGENVKRVVTIFQPHLYSRTQLHYKNFAHSLALSDFVFLAEIYPAREKPIKGVSSALITETFKRIGYQNYSYAPSFKEILNQLEDFLKPGDLVLTMGAGNIDLLGPQILALLKNKKKEEVLLAI